MNAACSSSLFRCNHFCHGYTHKAYSKDMGVYRVAFLNVVLWPQNRRPVFAKFLDLFSYLPDFGRIFGHGRFTAISAHGGLLRSLWDGDANLALFKLPQLVRGFFLSIAKKFH